MDKWIDEIFEMTERFRAEMARPVLAAGADTAVRCNGCGRFGHVVLECPEEDCA